MLQNTFQIHSIFYCNLTFHRCQLQQRSAGRCSLSRPAHWCSPQSPPTQTHTDSYSWLMHSEVESWDGQSQHQLLSIPVRTSCYPSISSNLAKVCLQSLFFIFIPCICRIKLHARLTFQSCLSCWSLLRSLTADSDTPDSWLEKQL